MAFYDMMRKGIVMPGGQFAQHVLASQTCCSRLCRMYQLCQKFSFAEVTYQSGHLAKVPMIWPCDSMRTGVIYVLRLLLMAGHTMDDGWHSDANERSRGGGGGATGPGVVSSLFQDYAAVADAVGVYTVSDYASIVEHLVNRWKVSCHIT